MTDVIPFMQRRGSQGGTLFFCATGRRADRGSRLLPAGVAGTGTRR